MAGTGDLFGSGHQRRMEVLLDLLGKEGVSAELILCSTETEIRRLTQEKCLVVLDARDFPAAEFHCPVIALDNRSVWRAKDQKSIYHDTIPHPEAPDVLENCLIDPAMKNLHRKEEESGILIYAGRQKIPEFLEHFAARRTGTTIVRESEMPRPEFLNRLAASSAVFSYFGMTVLEALFLSKCTALFSIESPVHNALSEHLERTCGVPFVRSEQDAEAALSHKRSACRPGERGYERLVRLIAKTSEAL